MITVASVVLVTLATAMMGYVLGRQQFPGKRVVIVAFLATLFLLLQRYFVEGVAGAVRG